ncbi:pseudouridine synthase [Nodosilinea sp. P-1105]|uniref:pseudouridine synthase n=1 Tax=Nodosilinea sp. P-1105 TaxID=2546229 RepID=UPI00146ECC20|nr:pseudouridine synthase [Nodosilinea sp. P-1105]NMF82382.1 rRNA pseudouridine synthase [Nodosilinea sp. P-1105]
MTETERLQKILSQYGIASRRKAEQLIEAGRVAVNGEVAHLGQKANPDSDRITVDNQPLRPDQRPQGHYLLLHKPLGMVSTCADPDGRPTVLDILPTALQPVGIHPVGRLDAYSSGALLLTNDGDFTYRLTHPKHDVAKTYQVRIEGQIANQTLDLWRQGIDLDGYQTRPAQVRRLGSSSPESTLLEVVLWEGRNRQIRRVAEALGHRVISLHRTAIGPVSVGILKSGAYRSLSSSEIKALLAESEAKSATFHNRFPASTGVSQSC